MRGFRLPLAVGALAFAASAAWGLNASATLFLGDRLNGNIVTPGENDSLSIYLPEGSVLSVDALAARDSAILPDLDIFDPAAAPIDTTAFSRPGPGGVGELVRGLAVPPGGGGVHEFRVIASGGTQGKYRFRCSARVPSRFRTRSPVDPAALASLTFDARAGSILRYSLRSSAGTATLGAPTLVAPDASLIILSAPSGTPVLLDQDGTWEIRVRNDDAAIADIAVSASLRYPYRPRVLYLSVNGFGPAPRVRRVTPRAFLDDRAYTGIEIRGLDFDPAADLRLERNGQSPVLPSGFTVQDPETILADFDFTGVLPGAWRLVVENPSGGLGRRAVAIADADSIRLPPGAVAGTEVWFLEFDAPRFRQDLAAAGLRSSTSSICSQKAQAAVTAYALRFLRLAFDLDPKDGAVLPASVGVSFVFKRPPAIVGAPGSEYDRLAVGGEAGDLDPSSNPNYAWGDSPLDTGNVVYDDVFPAPGLEGLGVRSRFLAVDDATGTPAFVAAVGALRDRPLTDADSKFFAPDYAANTVEEGTRYTEIEAAVRTAGKELAGTIAHFVARSMGTADGLAGLSSTPLLIGEFSALADFGFDTAEMDAMRPVVLPGLPGLSRPLAALPLPCVETSGFLMSNATTTEPYLRSFTIVGGRPERLPGDLLFALDSGTLPPGITLSADGTVSGTAPLRDAGGNLVGGVFRFKVSMTDVPANKEIFFQRRLNLLVDLADPSLTPAELQIGTQMNTATINEPDPLPTSGGTGGGGGGGSIY